MTIALRFIEQAATIALNSCCLRSRCGALIVQNGAIIGSGWNSPPGDIPLSSCRKDSIPATFRSDRTCCVHAEERTICDALKRNPAKLVGSRLYFIRVDADGNKLCAGKPYCTICSKLALDAGMAEFVLLHKEGIAIYATEEYNELSFTA